MWDFPTLHHDLSPTFSFCFLDLQGLKAPGAQEPHRLWERCDLHPSSLQTIKVNPNRYQRQTFTAATAEKILYVWFWREVFAYLKSTKLVERQHQGKENAICTKYLWRYVKLCLWINVFLGRQLHIILLFINISSGALEQPRYFDYI